jgi:hypothetical protein
MHFTGRTSKQPGATHKTGGLGFSQKAARMLPQQGCSPSWPTSSHRVSWKFRLPESSPSTTCATRSDKSNCATHAASWFCDREQTR